MDSITGLTKEYYEWKVKLSKKMVIFYAVFFLFSLSVTFYDLIALLHTRNYLSGISLGVMFTTTLWMFFYLFDSLFDLKADKSTLKFHTELYETQLASSERQQYLNAKQAYEQMIIFNSSQEKNYES